jgi:transcriptional regulator with XRE-family HTH domain
MTAQAPNRKALIKQKGLSLTALARRFRITLGHLSRVVSGERRSPRLARRLARALGAPVEELFPGRTNRRERGA